MRPGSSIGPRLILAGVIAVSVGGFSFTTRDKVAEVGPSKSRPRTSDSALSALLSGLAITAGVVLIVASSGKGR